VALTDPSGKNSVPLHDALGSTLWMVNASGQMQTAFAYSSFGMPSQSGTAYYYAWLFAGMEWRAAALKVEIEIPVSGRNWLGGYRRRMPRQDLLHLPPITNWRIFGGRSCRAKYMRRLTHVVKGTGGPTWSWPKAQEKVNLPRIGGHLG